MRQLRSHIYHCVLINRYINIPVYWGHGLLHCRKTFFNGEDSTNMMVKFHGDTIRKPLLTYSKSTEYTTHANDFHGALSLMQILAWFWKKKKERRFNLCSAPVCSKPGDFSHRRQNAITMATAVALQGVNKDSPSLTLFPTPSLPPPLSRSENTDGWN